jgi:ABC-type phosphate transport system substrate-binding protein
MISIALASSERPDDILIITHKSVPISTLSEAELKSIFLKQRQSWQGGMRVVPINAKDGTPLRQKFRSRVMKMDPEKEAKYWQDEKIKKGTVPPAEFSNTLKAVFLVKGAISYVFRKDFNPGLVKIIAVF